MFHTWRLKDKYFMETKALLALNNKNNIDFLYYFLLYLIYNNKKASEMGLEPTTLRLEV